MSFIDIIRTILFGDEIAIFHEFKKPPYGGGNQFLLALKNELQRQGFRVGGRVGRDTEALLMNSFNFAPEKVKGAKRNYPNLRIVHRLAGPIGIYRGTDTMIDRKTQNLNAELADATIFQSHYSADAYQKLGLEFTHPVVIHNAVDPEIFHPHGRIAPPDGIRKIRLIATSWSDNPKKGGPLLLWLDEHLDRNRYTLTFVGRTKAQFKHSKVIDAMPSRELADILRDHDIYIAPSQDDPCSNALLEALACGLPAAFLQSGGHPELVVDAGVPFHGTHDILYALDRIAADWHSYHDLIRIDSLEVVGKKYSDILL